MKRAFWLVPTKVLIFKFCLRVFEEDFNLPMVLIDASNGGGPKLKVIGEENDYPVIFDIIHFDPPQGLRTGSLGVIAGEGNDLIFEDMPVLRNLPFLNYSVVGIVFLSGDKVNTSVGPPGKEGIIGVTPINCYNRTLGKGKIMSDVHFVNYSFSD